MDKFDQDILQLLQFDSRQTAEVISQSVGLSPAAVQKRIKKLRDTTLIQKEIAVLDPAKLGKLITVIVDVSLEKETSEVLTEFKRNISHSPQVQQCYYTTGEVDFILIVIVQDIDKYQEFAAQYLHANPIIRKFRSSVVLERVKIGLGIDIDSIGLD